MSEEQWELVTDGEYILQPGVDQVRYRYLDQNGEWEKWGDWLTICSRAAISHWRQSFVGLYEFRRPQQSVEMAPTQPELQKPATTAGSKYKRQIHQTLSDGRAGASVIVDIYDVLRAWDVTCPAIQHAIKKLLQPGQRGSKSAAQDLREAIASIERAIQLMGDGGPVLENFQNSGD